MSTIREATRGVSLDEELADLMKFQRSFEAASRVIRTADEMMTTVLGLKS
jgi:flagellar hook-associated protein 1 FlgK